MDYNYTLICSFQKLDNQNMTKQFSILSLTYKWSKAKYQLP